MVVTLFLRNGARMFVEAENRAVGSVAEQGATQTDEHRDRRWTLSLRGKTLDPEESANDAGIIEGDHCELVELPKPKSRRSIVSRILEKLSS